MTKEAMKLAKSTGLIERLYYKGTTPEDTDAILRFYDAGLAHAKAVCVSVCEQTDEDGEGPDQWDWHAKDYASALRQALDHIANGGKMIEQPAQQEPVNLRRGDLLRCIETDELCTVWFTSTTGKTLIKWSANNFCEYTAEQIGELFWLEPKPDDLELAAEKFDNYAAFHAGYRFAVARGNTGDNT